MEQNQINALLSRRERAVGRTATWMDLLKNAYKLAIPNRNPWEMTSEGTNMNWDVYDSTLVMATKKFVHNTINALMPPGKNFVKLVAGREIPDEEKEEKNKQLQKITETFFHYLDQSNFDLVISEAFMDMAISTGVMQINEGDDDHPLIFSAIPSDQVSFETGPRGEFSAFFRDWHDLRPEHCFELWGDDFVLPERYKDDDQAKLELYEISYYDYKEKTYRYVVIDKHTKEMAYFREENSWEWVAFRMSKLPGEDRGRGPVLDALPSAATINKAVEDELTAAALQAAPVYMAYTNAIVNPYNFKIAPNEIIPVNPMGSDQWPIAPLPSAGNINFTAIVVNDLRSQINEIMMTQPLQPIFNAPDRTATEVAINQNTIRENASAAYQRIQRELFDPIVDRVLYILRKKGLVGDVVVDGKSVSLTYSTPLGQSKEQAELESFMQFYQIMIGFFGPEMSVNLVDSPKLPRWVGEKLNSKLDLIKDETEILMMIQQAQEQAENAAEAAIDGPGQA